MRIRSEFLLLLWMGAFPSRASSMAMAVPDGVAPVTWPMAVTEVFNKDGAQRQELLGLIADLNSPTLSNLAGLDLNRPESAGRLEAFFQGIEISPRESAALTPEAVLGVRDLRVQLHMLAEAVRLSEERANETAVMILGDMDGGRITPKRAAFVLAQARSLLEQDRLGLSPGSLERLEAGLPRMDQLAAKAVLHKPPPLRVYYLTSDFDWDRIQKNGALDPERSMVEDKSIYVQDLKELTQGGWKNTYLLPWLLKLHINSRLKSGSDMVMLEIEVRPEDHASLAVKEYKPSRKKNGEFKTRVRPLSEFLADPKRPAAYEFVFKRSVPLERVALVSQIPSDRFPGSHTEVFPSKPLSTREVDGALKLLLPPEFWRLRAQGEGVAPPRLWIRPTEWEESVRERAAERLSRRALRIFSAYLSAGDYSAARAFLAREWAGESDPILAELGSRPSSPQAVKFNGLKDIFQSLAEGNVREAKAKAQALRESLEYSWEFDFRFKELFYSIVDSIVREGDGIKGSLMDFYEYASHLYLSGRNLPGYYGWLFFDSMSGMGGGAFDQGLASMRDQFWRDVGRWNIRETRNDRTIARHADYFNFRESDPF